MRSRRPAILITGAAGGLGKALVTQLAQKESRLILAIDIDATRLKELEVFGKVETFQADLTDLQVFPKIKAWVETLGVEVEVLINNAGISDFFPVSEVPPQRLNQILDINTLAPIRMVSTFLDHLVEQKGTVVQISSESVKRTGLFQPYSATKIALEAFSQVMRQELDCKGVQLILIRPGAIKTPLLGGLEQAVTSNQGSRYLKELKAFRKQALGMVGKEAYPDAIAGRIIQVLASNKPRRVYQFNNNLILSLFAALPESWSDRIVRYLILKKRP